ncbi:response regulator [Nocardiopsis aegyptia]|uniref:response regulator n=1 Tax=Nocardiopsis aegyptia TaxID=220378 RepID=UPI00366B7EF5
MSAGEESRGHGDARVLVVDDQRLVREGIASLLGIQSGITVVGTAADGAEAVDRALELEPDVVLMDVRMPGMDGVEAVAVLRERAPGCRIVMLTTFDDEEYVVRALRAGASGYLLKDLPARELAEAVRLARAGVAQFDASAVARLAAALPAPSDPGSAPRGGTARDGGLHGGRHGGPHGGPLTERETQVLRLIAVGATNREIARELFVSEGTVKNHISRILVRLGLRDRTHAAVHAREHGLI